MYYGVFAVALPKDQPKTEVTWTLTANGQTLSIPASLDPLYLISPQRETGTAYPGNTPPVLKFDPTGPSAQGPHGIVASRTATVSRPLTLDVWVTDDGLPPPKPEHGCLCPLGRCISDPGAGAALAGVPRRRRRALQRPDAGGRAGQGAHDGDLQRAGGLHAALAGDRFAEPPTGAAGRTATSRSR